jgi:hypothetical protein
MKNVIILLSVFLLILSFGSCNSDDDNSSENYETLIVGKWEWTESGKVIDGSEVIDQNPNTVYKIIHFLANKIYSEDAEIMFGGTVFNYSFNGYWEIEEEKITIFDGNFEFSEVYSIKALNSNVLKLYHISNNTLFYNVFNKIN